MKEVEISLKSLLFYILSHWRSFIVGMVIGALLVGGFKAYMDVNSSTDTDESAGKLLTESEKAYVDAIYENIENLQMQAMDREESVLCKLDPNNSVWQEMTLLIRAENSDDMDGIEQAYRLLLTGSECYGYISEKTGLSEADIANELIYTSGRYITTSSSTTTTMVIGVVAIDEKSASEISEAAYDYIMSKSGALTEKGFNHEIFKIGEAVSDVLPAEQVDIINQAYSELQSINKTIIDTEAGLKDEQKKYYESLMTDISEQSEAASTAVSNHFHISFKYVLVGLFLGAFVVFGIYMLIYIITNKLEEDDDFEKLYGLYFYGMIPGEEYGKAVYRLKNLGRRTFGPDESCKLIASKIKLSAEKNNIKKFGILGNNILNTSKDIYEKLVAYLRASGIETILIDNALYDENSIGILNSVENVVICEKAGETFRNEVWKETELSEKLGIKILGMMIIGR